MTASAAAEGQRLYLFSSNSTDLYLQDAINTLSQPAGSIIHFRYDRLYLQSTLWGQLAEGLRGCEVLLCLFNHQFLADNVGTPATDVIFPLRYGRLVDVEWDDSVAHFWVKLASPVQVDTEVGYGQMVHNLTTRLGAYLPTATPGVFAALGDGSPLPQSPSDQNAFRTVVEVISKTCLDASRMAFVQLDAVQEVDWSQQKFVSSPDVTSKLPAWHAYAWKPDVTYAIGFSWYAPPGKGPKGSDGQSLVLQIEHNAEHLAVVGRNVIPLNGRYDKSYLYVTPRTPNKSLQTNLTFKVVQQDGKAPASVPPNLTVLGLNFTFPIVIDAGEVRAKRTVAYAETAIAVGLFLVAIAGIVPKAPSAEGTAGAEAAVAAKAAPAMFSWENLSAEGHWLLLIAAAIALVAAYFKARASIKL